MDILPNEDFTLDSDNKLVRIPLAKKGSWYHDQYGVVSFTDEDFDSLERNFEADVLGYKPYITFGHLDEEDKSTDSHRKRGDLLRFDRSNDTLFGIFQAKPEALDAIKDGQYEFASGEFIRGLKNKVDGSSTEGLVLERSALTNSPFIPFSEEDKAMALSEGKNKNLSCFKLSMSAATLEGNVERENTVNTEEKDSKTEIKEEEKEEAVAEKPTQSSQETQPQFDMAEKESSTEPEVDDLPIKHIEEEDNMPQDNKQELSNSSAVVEKEDETVSTTAEQEIETKLETKVETEAEASGKPDALDIEALVKASLKEVVSSYEDQIKELKEEIKSQKETQEKLSNSFQERLSHEQRIALSQSLSSVGVPPALIERLQLVRQALSNKSETIKLSQGETESEVDVFKVITNLVTDALGVTPVEEGQQGQSGKVEDDFHQSLKSIVDRNRKLVETK